MKRITTLCVLLGLFVLTQWSSSLYLPIAPKMATLFATHKQWIVSSLSVFFLGYAIGQLFWGMLSDYIGRYVTLCMALLLYCIFSLSMISAHHAGGFLILLSLTGFFTSANTSVGNALIKDRYGKQSNVIIGYVGIAMACAPVVAPIIGTRLYLGWHWPAIFVFLSLVGFLLFLLFSILFRQNEKERRLKNKQANAFVKKPTVSIVVRLNETLSDKTFSAYSGILSITFGVFFALLLVTPFLLVHGAHLSIKRVGYLMFMMTLTYIAGAVINVWLSKKKTSRLIVNLGLVLMSCGALIFLVNSVVFSHWLSFLNVVAIAIGMLGIGAVLPAAKAGALLARDHHVGTAASIMKFTQTMGCVVLTKIASYSINHHVIETFLVALAGVILVLTVSSVAAPMMVKSYQKNHRVRLS